MKKKLNLLFIFFSILIYAQHDNFDIYIQKNRYVQDSINGSKYKKYDFLANYYIDRDRQDTINYKYLKQGLSKLVPNILDSVFISLDLENKIYKDIKSSNRKVREYAVDRFVKMVKFVKEERPNAKVGIYGLPFRFNYKHQKKHNHFFQLKKLLKEVDYLSPSLYFDYSEEQQDDKKLVKYIESNLALFLKYSKKLNKPIYLYTWYLIHPYNKRYGLNIVSNKRMNLYLNTIKKYEYKGDKVDGIIWWESHDSNYKLGKEKTRKSITQILKEYTESL